MNNRDKPDNLRACSGGILPNKKPVLKKQPKPVRRPPELDELVHATEEGQILTQEVARLLCELQDSIDQVQLIRERSLRLRTTTKFF